MSRLKKIVNAVSNLTYLFCEDWFIYAYDNIGNIYMLNTELWDEWLDIPDEEQNKNDSVEKFMLPLAQKKWNRLSWENTGETLWTIWGNISEDELQKKFSKYNVNLPIKKEG